MLLLKFMNTGDQGQSDPPSGWCHIPPPAPLCPGQVLGWTHVGMVQGCRGQQQGKTGEEKHLLAIANHLDGFSIFSCAQG